MHARLFQIFHPTGLPHGVLLNYLVSVKISHWKYHMEKYREVFMEEK